MLSCRSMWDGITPLPVGIALSWSYNTQGRCFLKHQSAYASVCTEAQDHDGLSSAPRDRALVPRFAVERTGGPAACPVLSRPGGRTMVALPNEPERRRTERLATGAQKKVRRASVTV